MSDARAIGGTYTFRGRTYNFDEPPVGFHMETDSAGRTVFVSDPGEIVEGWHGKDTGGGR